MSQLFYYAICYISSHQCKLNESYINYFSFKPIDKNIIEFYRVVDININETVSNCNHIPFNKRNLAKHGRFNLYGFPCLYLSDNINICCKEVGDIDKERTRYFSVFTHKKQTLYLNLTLPNKNSALSNYDKFCFIITYPILFLCLSSTSGDSPFEEEYLFPQLLFPSLFLTYRVESVSHVGIAYNSTKDYSTLNLVIPAKLKPDEVSPHGAVAEFVSSIIEESKPNKYNLKTFIKQ